MGALIVILLHVLTSIPAVVYFALLAGLTTAILYRGRTRA